MSATDKLNELFLRSYVVDLKTARSEGPETILKPDSFEEFKLDEFWDVVLQGKS